MLFEIFRQQIVVGGQWLLLQNIPPKGGREVVSTLFRLDNHHILFDMHLPLPILSWCMAWRPLETSYGDGARSLIQVHDYRPAFSCPLYLLLGRGRHGLFEHNPA